MDSIKIVKKNILEYLNFLEKPKEEFSGHPTCPYASKESKDDKISQGRLEKIKRLQRSGNPRDAAELLSNYI